MMQRNKVEPKAYYGAFGSQCMILEHSLHPDGITCMLFFSEGRKLEKNPRSRVENQYKLNLPVASALTTTPTLLP